VPSTTCHSCCCQGIVHRDIKSENVFRTASGVWKLGDFGSSLRVGDERLLAKQVLKLEGTFSFAAPEYISIWSAFTKTQLTAATSFKVRGVEGGGGEGGSRAA
jgi:serine/threonine protein kinase